MHIQFAELGVSDQDRAVQFYLDHFGCEVTSDAPMGGDGWRWIELKFPGEEHCFKAQCPCWRNPLPQLAKPPPFLNHRKALR